MNKFARWADDVYQEIFGMEMRNMDLDQECLGIVASGSGFVRATGELYIELNVHPQKESV